MSGDEITVDGAATFAATMHGAAVQLGDFTTANSRAGLVISAAARSRAPVRTGRLRGSIRSAASEDEVRVGAGAPYAPYVEFGVRSRGISPHPFLRPAVEQTERGWLPAYEQRVQGAVATVKGT